MTKTEENKENTVIGKSVQSEQTKDSFSFILNKEWVNKSLPAILVLSTLAIFYIYIANSHVKKLNEIEKLKQENQELRSELIAIQTDLMTKSKQSEVANRVRERGLKEMRKPPFQLKDEKNK